MVLRSIASRTALWVLVGSTVVLAAMGALLFGLTRAQILEHTHHEAASLAANAGSQIQARIDRIAVSAQMLAAIVATRQDDAEPLLRDTLAANLDMDGLAAVFRPSSNPADAPPYSPFVHRLDDSTLTSRDLSHDPNPYWNNNWFLGGLGCASGCWQRPFFSLSRHRQLINYSIAIQRNGYPIGIVNADVTLDWLHQILGNLDKPAGAYAFVLDSDGDYLAHDNPDLVGKRGAPALLDALASDHAETMRLPVAQNSQVRGPIWIYSAPIEGTRWRLGLAVPEYRIYAGVRHIFLLSLALGLLALLGVALITLLTIRRTMAPLGVLADRAEHVARGELDFELPPARRPDEVGRLTESFGHMRRELALHLEDLARVAREKQRLASELEIAHQIQLGLLPNAHYLDAVCAHFELHAALRPARAVGGDLYSYFMLDPERFFVMVGDVSDKGIPAALFMAQTITLAKALAPRAQTPQNLLRLLNLELCRGNDSCMFVTLLCGLLDTGSGSLVLASAGHEPPILCGRGAPQLLEFPTGAVLGLYEDSDYPEHRLRLHQGETLLMYTDGITEANNHGQQMYGIERTVESLAQVPPTAATAVYIERLLGDVDRFVADAAQADDITLLALTWHGAALPGTEICVDNQLLDVFAALDRCEHLLQEADVPASLLGGMRLVLEELMVNTVEYGYPDGRASQIRLLLQPQPGVVTIELIDAGIAFDPLQSAAPTLTGDLADREQVGGLGIHLARTMTDEMRYTRDAQGNHLLLRFTYPAQDESSS
ncbi:SpoIIE family protein phosphatase [Rhodanobacter sp. Col0626]|uniref:SpoIIE family protein phosphatase n=1 Tax=Rhodanobacter sp. Col0626 TaxID=3415679 RepID=UPI003CF3D5E1